MASALNYALNYDSAPLSKRLAITEVGTQHLTSKNMNKDVGKPEELPSGYDFTDPDSGYTPLINAVVNRKVPVVRVLIDRGADIEFREKRFQCTALIIAAKLGFDDVIDHLLFRGAQVNQVDKYHMTGLMYACKGGFISCVKHLVERGATLNIVDDEGYSGLHYAAKFGHKTIVEYLVYQGATMEARDLVDGYTALHMASQYGRVETVAALADSGAKLNRRSSKDKFSALMLACREGHKLVVSTLISKGADANVADMYGWTALHFAASWGRRDTAHLLIVEGGAKVNARDQSDDGKGGVTALVIATKGHQIDLMKLLLNYGADVNLPELDQGKAPAACAAELGDVDTLQVLIDYQAVLNAKNIYDGTTPLMLAARRGHRAAIKLLLNYFADVNILDNSGSTSLDHATRTGRKDIYLSMVVQISPDAKVNLIPWLELQSPKMVRGSECGGPAVYFNDCLYKEPGVYSGLYSMPGDTDVYLAYSLTMLAAACKRSWERHVYDRAELEEKVKEVDQMLVALVAAKALCLDDAFTDVFVLGAKPCNTLGEYDIKYFSSAFFNGPLALYIENDLTELLITPQMTERIDRYFTCCIKDAGLTVNGFGTATAMLRLRYCPAFMFAAEGFMRLLFLAAVIWHSTISLPSSAFESGAKRESSGFALSGLVVAAYVVSLLFYEIGQMEEKRWAVSPSIVFDYAELQRRRWARVHNHIVQDVWKFFDFLTCLLGFVWLALSIVFDSGSTNGLAATGEALLSISAIPTSIGLLRYVSLVSKEFGVTILNVFLMMRNLACFAVVFLFTGLGFGVALFAIYRGTINELGTPTACLQTLFNAIFHNYDSALFSDSSNTEIGVALSFGFMIMGVFVLFNAVIAQMASNYGTTTQEAIRLHALIKCRTIQQFNLSYEKSALCQLPPLLNLITVACYPFQFYYVWRSQLYTIRVYAITFGGTVSDWVLILLALLPCAMYEYWLRIFCPDRKHGSCRKMLMLLFYPLGVLFVIYSLLRKALRETKMRLILKSRLSDGRLRVSYGLRRDAFEDKTLGRFEDERLHKVIDHYNKFVDKEDLSMYSMSSSTAKSAGTDQLEMEHIKQDHEENYQFLPKWSKTRPANYTGVQTRIAPEGNPFLQLALTKGQGIESVLQSVANSQQEGITGQAIEAGDGNGIGFGIGASSNPASPFRTASWGKTVMGGALVPSNAEGQSDEMKMADLNGYGPESPDMLLREDGSISLYQPGFTSPLDVANMSNINNQDDLEYNEVGNSNDEMRMVNYPSIYFLANKYKPIFTFAERKRIFEKVLPEAFVDEVTAAIRDNEGMLMDIQEKLFGIMSKKAGRKEAELNQRLDSSRRVVEELKTTFRHV